MKAAVVQEIRSNQHLESDLSVMDIKIGLLVKNRISLQDVVTHAKQVKRKDKRRGVGTTSVVEGATGGIGGLSKANQEKLEVRGRIISCGC